MSVVASSYVDDAVGSLRVAVGAGAPLISESAQAVASIDAVERARRLAAVVAVDVLDQIDTSRSFVDHGHANARVMFAHVGGVSGAEAGRLDKIRRMVSRCEELAGEWRKAAMSVDKAAVLARAFANPRTRERFVVDQRWFIKQARRFSFVRFTKIVARWVEVHDDDGREPPSDPSYENRSFSVRQDHFAKAWKTDGTLGSLQGSHFSEVHAAYVEAEFAYDWAAAERVHGPNTRKEHLGRTDAQRAADALCQIAADAVNSNKRSAPVKRVHNIVWTAETYEALLQRWAGGAGPVVDPDNYGATDLDANPINVATAFADSIVSTLRRVVANAAGVTINMSTHVRLFTGLARLGVEISANECYWPGCHIPTSRCQIDHITPAARGGPTNQINGQPCCKRHNRLKQHGYTITRQPNGAITITTPKGDHLTST